MAEDERVEAGLSHEERQPERGVRDRAAGEERPQQRAKRRGRAGHARDHPDPRGDLERQEAERQQREDDVRHVVVDERIGRLRVDRHRGRRVPLGIPRAHADEHAPRTGPETGEVIGVDHLEPPAERSEEGDEQDPGEDGDPERDVGTARGRHRRKR